MQENQILSLYLDVETKYGMRKSKKAKIATAMR
jgi:hypothetical protein